MSTERAFVFSPPGLNFFFFLSQWLCSAAVGIYKGQRRLLPSDKKLERKITIVCISDTLNHQPDLPPADILLHAGDLTEYGTFEELQTQLTWLSSQPHTYKIMIAGEHDTLLDPPFTTRFPHLYPNVPGKTVSDLNFGSVIYLRESSITIQFPDHGAGREVAIYGSPTISSHPASAFGVPRDVDPWKGAVPRGTDVLLAHSPPCHRLGGDRESGCHYLGMEIERVKPQLVVFGHVHSGYGQEHINFSQPVLPRPDDNKVRQGKGTYSLGQLSFRNLWKGLVAGYGFISYFFPGKFKKDERVTTLINASLVNDEFNDEPHIMNTPMVTSI